MKPFVVSAFLCLASFAHAEWASVSTQELLKKTDLIVVAQLTEIREYTKDGVDYGSGTLVVSRVLRGPATADRKLKIKWSNASRVACPRVEHRHHAGKTLIWLLQKSPDGAVTANYPGRVLAPPHRPELIWFLKR